MKNCIFCKINKGTEKALIIWENEYITCFLPKNMEVIGHTLVIPKKHFENIFDIDEKYLLEITKGIKIISELLKNKLNADGINILNANGKNAGQSVFHLHFHIMPRFKDDNLNLWPEIKKNNIDRNKIYTIIKE